MFDVKRGKQADSMGDLLRLLYRFKLLIVPSGCSSQALFSLPQHWTARKEIDGLGSTLVGYVLNP